MLFDESDVDINHLVGHEFEELCLDRLHRPCFLSLKWRQGGADKGRRYIEASYSLSNPFVGINEET